MIDTSLDSLNFYFLLAVFQGLVLSGFILFHKPFRLPNLYIGLLIVLFSFVLLHLVLEKSIHAFNAKFPVPMDFSFSYGPLVYLHVLSIKQPNRSFKFQDFYHFIPSILIDGVFFSAFFTYIRFNMEWAYAHLEEIQALGLTIAAVGVIQLFVYTFLTYREAKRVKLALKEFKAINRWLNYILMAWITIIAFLLIAIPIALLNIEKFDDNSFLIYKPLGTFIGICIYGIGYLYLVKFMKVVGTYTDKVVRFKFSEQELSEKKEKLVHTLESEVVYTDPELNVAKLAQQLGWPINDLSRMINETFQTNFNDLINRYRVKAFKELMQDEENKKYSLLGLSEKVGFSSKASFYRAFKKETGMTPSAYLQSK